MLQSKDVDDSYTATEAGSYGRISNDGSKMKDLDFITILIMIVLDFIIVGTIFSSFDHVYPLTLLGQYTVSNYTSYDSNFKMFLLSKEKLNFTILTNENDITDKLLVLRVHNVY